jgi:uncharacterized protein
MRITFLGGADEVGASCLLVEAAGRRLLVDAGIRMSDRPQVGVQAGQLPAFSLIDEAGGLDVCLVTHAHTDHTGALALVAERFPNCPILATPMTIALVRVLQRDAQRIMQSRLEQESELPLFDQVALDKLLAALSPVPFNARVPLANDLVATWFPAGHIAGAAMIGLETSEGRLLISGDLAISDQRSVAGARPPAFQPDALVLESTYGGRMHAHRATEERRLVDTIVEVTEGGGKVLIPAFALGRSQEIVLTLNAFRRQGLLPPVPVWLDGMVRAVCGVYKGYPDTLPLPLREIIENGEDPFLDEHTHLVERADQRNALVWEPGPVVIIASSGMLSGGPSPQYARGLAGDERNAILLTGYQDEESPGRQLQAIAERGHGTLRLGKDRVKTRCRIGTYALSAHADEGQLISLTETLGPTDVLLVHGDAAARDSLASRLEERGRFVRQPRAGQSVELDYRTTVLVAHYSGIGRNQPLDLARLWRALIGAGGGFFTAEELARAWWGHTDQVDELTAALAADDRYFAPDGHRDGLYRARSEAQVAAIERYRSARAAGAEEHSADGRLPAQAPEAPPAMEPNQALAAARVAFAPAARLRKAGYRLDGGVLTLTFDFPDAAALAYAETIACLATDTGWRIELAPEANQVALVTAVGELLPGGWQLLKAPAIHREDHRVAITAHGDPDQADDLAGRYEALTGYRLDVAIPAATAGLAAPVAGAQPQLYGEPLEINAAYQVLKDELAGTTLYRTSLKAGTIVLSFISPQVGARHAERIAELSAAISWPLAVNPNPNQGEILAVTQRLATAAGWAVTRGPGLNVATAEVRLTASPPPDPASLARVAEDVLAATGYRLVVDAPAGPTTPTTSAQPAARVIEIPLARIQLTAAQRALPLDPDKTRKELDRARRNGNRVEPIRVRRLSDGYRVLDGVRRVQVAEALGLTTVPAVVEE